MVNYEDWVGFIVAPCIGISHSSMFFVQICNVGAGSVPGGKSPVDQLAEGYRTILEGDDLPACIQYTSGMVSITSTMLIYPPSD